MARAFKRLLSLCSALAMTVLALPVTELPAAAQETETEAQLLYGDINLDGVIDAEDSSALSQAINKKTASELVNADLNGDGKVNNSDALMLSQFVSGELAYFPVGDVYIAGVSFVTRGEWIHSLVTAFDMSVEDRSSMETYFTDLSGNAYAEEIELAANFGVFEAESDEFSPDAMVTREFAAHTANFCIGYLNETVVSFADSGDIFYEDDASVAVLRGWFAAIEHQFRPALYMNSDEADVILGDLKGAREADTIRTDAPEVIEYADSVIQVDDSVDATLVGNTVTINSDEVSILAGDIFTVNIDGTQCLYKASSVSIGKNGQVVADVEEAPLEDAVSNVNIQGIGEVDYSNITYYSDGTDTVQTNAAGVMYLPRTQVLAAASSGSNSVKLDHTFDLGGTKVYLSGTLSNIQPEYKLQWNGLSVDSFTLNMKADANFTAKVSDSFTSTKSKEVKIASVPVACGGLLTAEVGIYITVSLSGEIQVSYSCDVMGGVTYTKDGGWRTNRNFQKKSFTLDAKASESIAIKASASVKFATTTLGNAYVMVGEKGTIQANKRETGLECATLRAYVFAEYGASLNLFGLKTFSNSTEFINESNSPVRIVRHWENDVLVDHCTYGEDLSYSSSTKKKRRNYTTYSNYGTEYEGIITLSNSSESRSDGSVTRWEGSITLTKDTEVYGDLFLTNWQTTENGKTVSHSFSSLDLDGYSLTVYGDIIQTQGTVTVNNGTLNVYGGYVMRNATVNNVGEIEYNDCSARLYMANEHDKVNISGDFTTHRLNSVYNVRLYYGVFSVAGDIWTDGGVSAESDRGNRIVLNGSGTQKVYTSTDYTTFNQLEVTDPGARQIVYGGKMKIRRLGSDINILSDDLNLYSLDLNQKTMTITGDTGMTNSNTVNLNGGILTIRGNFLHKTGTITCNNGTLNVTGNYTMENATTNNVGETEYNSCSAYLNMNNEHDKVNISGDFTTHNLSGYENVELYYGVFSVAGDVWTDGGVSARYDYGNRVILNGSGTQRIYTSTNYTTFNQLEATDPEARQIVYSGDLYIRRLGSDINIKSDDLNLRWADLNQHTMTITGDTKMTNSGTIDLNGGILTIKGNFLHKTGTITCNNGTLNVTGNYTMENTTTNNVGETEYNSCSAKLSMGKVYDKVNIGGSFTTHSLGSTANVELYYGVFSVAGDIWTDGGVSARYDYGNRVILNGSGTQRVYTNMDYTTFNQLEVTDPEARQIVYSGDLYIRRLGSDINIKSDDLNLRWADLNQHTMTITGDTKMTNSGSIDLNGGILTIKGNFLHKTGTITCNNGTLNVTGNYTMEDTTTNNVGEIQYNSCSAKMNMANEHDKVNVGGNLTTHKLSTGSSINLQRGMLSVGGNIWSDGGISTSSSYGHKTVLTGSKKQTVTLSSSNKFNILILTKPLSNYTFSPEECWNSLIMVETGTGDVNFDGTVNVTDAVLVQKYLVVADQFNKAQSMAGDLNGDGAVNVIDLTLLKRKLLSA